MILENMIPVNRAVGNISPKNKTRVTDMIIARYSGTSPDRNTGKASVATAFLKRYQRGNIIRQNK
jgi:hypothetical protein